MDSRRRDNPLANVARSRRQPALRVNEFVPPEILEGRHPERPLPQRPVPPARPVTVAVADVSLKDLLSSRAALRRAMILSEIVGPPKALRRDE